MWCAMSNPFPIIYNVIAFFLSIKRCMFVFTGDISLSFATCPASYQELCGICSPPLLQRIARSYKQFLGTCAVWTWDFSYYGNRGRNRCGSVSLHAHGKKARLMHRIPLRFALPVSAHGKAQRYNRKLHPLGFLHCLVGITAVKIHELHIVKAAS